MHAAPRTRVGISFLLCVLVGVCVIVLSTLHALFLPGDPAEVVLVPRGIVVICM